MVVLTVIIVIICVILVLAVLIQKSKGGGLAAGFQSANVLAGAPRTTDFLEKATWTLMGIIALLCVVSTKLISYSSVNEGSAIEQRENALPTMPENVATDEAPAEVEVPAEASAE